ncbi:flagellar motor switch phosphatase FliY [Marinococcus luteus]|uniref:flagellar motor switch phosphatase FliY n=1 Tax=Marinococcus luteus TaxID=1122204 RepID=UPI002ACCA3E6|nr:flagellar motor switch phosphatase FliY [Marinococcus luteus]MDZ5781819.1 flagellar motor switch phosphatase FliY [Marinococcus luteus]
MSNDDMLSQDEINELLKNVGADDDDGGASSGETPAEEIASSTEDEELEHLLSTEEKDTLGEIGNISFSSAATALSSLLNQKVSITIPGVKAVSTKMVEKSFPRPHVAVNVEYTEGFEGTNLFVISMTDASIIANLMMGGDGQVDEAAGIDEMQQSAVQEAMNQMMGSASTSMSTIFNKRVDISPPGVNIMNLEEEESARYIPDEDTVVQIAFRIQIGELMDSYIMQLIPLGFAKKMVEELLGASTEAPQPESKHQPAPEPSERQEAEPQRTRAQETKAAPTVSGAAFSELEEPAHRYNDGGGNLDMLMDISLDVTVELGRSRQPIKDILSLSQGSVVELDKLAGEPVDVLVNQKPVAKGEVVVIDENFGVRITEILSPRERVAQLK